MFCREWYYEEEFQVALGEVECSSIADVQEWQTVWAVVFFKLAQEA